MLQLNAFRIKKNKKQTRIENRKYTSLNYTINDCMEYFNKFDYTFYFFIH